MAEEKHNDDAPRIIVDSDWKQEASQEKARLAEEAAKTGPPPPLPDPTLPELINMIAVQASIGLGGYKAPTGETVPPDLGVAKHYIDLLDLLKTKTHGNATVEETKLLDGVLYELRMQYVHAVSAQPGKSPSARQADGK